MDGQYIYSETRRDRLVGLVERRFRSNMERGVQVTEGRGNRQIEVAGIARIEVDFQARTVRAYRRGRTLRPGDMRAQRAWIADDGIDVLDPVNRYRLESHRQERAWMDIWVGDRAWALWRGHTLRDLFRASPSHERPRMFWMDARCFALARLQRIILKERWRERMAADIRAALGLSEELLQLASRVIVSEPRVALSARHLTLAWQNAAALRQVERDNPRLGWAYALALDEGSALEGREPLQALRSVFAREGVCRRGWTMLCNHPRRDFEGLVRGSSGALQWLASALRFHEALGCWEPLPEALQRQLVLSLRNDDTELDHDLFRLLLSRLPAWKAFIAEALARGAQGVEDFVQSEGPAFRRWATDGRGPDLPNRGPRPGWRTVRNLVRRHLAIEDARAEGVSRTWEAVLGTCTAQGLEAVELVDAGQLEDEGAAMRHCASGYRDACASNGMRFFSLREPGSGRRVATAALLRRDGGWGVYQVKGLANAEPDGRAVSAAHEIAALCAMPPLRAA